MISKEKKRNEDNSLIAFCTDQTTSRELFSDLGTSFQERYLAFMPKVTNARDQANSVNEWQGPGRTMAKRGDHALLLYKIS